MPHSGRFDMSSTTTWARTPVSVTPTSSPYVMTAHQAGLVSITGGTVSLVQYQCGGSLVTLGIANGVTPIAPGDSIRVTWAVTAPAVTFVPGSP